jgi:hypothetical protein
MPSPEFGEIVYSAAEVLALEEKSPASRQAYSTLDLLELHRLVKGTSKNGM